MIKKFRFILNSIVGLRGRAFPQNEARQPAKSSFEVDNQFDFRGLLHWKIGWLGPF
jgi:hypothetical protein